MGSIRRAAVIVATALLVLLGAEISARVLGPALPAPEEWPDDTTAVKVAQVEALGCIDIVIAGSSIARDGFDPALITEADGRSVYNASLDAAGPRQLARWLDDVVIPGLEPSMVVLVLSSADLNDSGAASGSAESAYASSQGGDDSLTGRVTRQATGASSLVEYRQSLRSPELVTDAIASSIDGRRSPRPDPGGLPGIIGPLGEGISRRDLRYDGDPTIKQFVREQLLNDFEIGGVQAEATAALLDSLNDRGITTVLVIPPVTDDFVDLHPGGDAEYQAYLDTMTELADDHGAQLVDLSAAVDTGSKGRETPFADTHHLNGDGARTIAPILAAQLPGSDTRCD